MLILTPTTEPPKAPFRRAHAPPTQADHAKYRPCLRWDFGFYCAFCLLHERDFFTLGVEGLRLYWIEHFRPQSDATASEEERRRYSNCYYACSLCNHARGTEPLEDGGVTLLDPNTDAWGDHFDLVDDRFVANQDDRRARRTDLGAYDLNDEKKVGLRKLRRTTIDGNMRVLEHGPARIESLLQAASENTAARGDLLREAEEWRDHISRAWETLKMYGALPDDRPTECACSVASGLPENMSHAVQDLHPPVPPR